MKLEPIEMTDYGGLRGAEFLFSTMTRIDDDGAEQEKDGNWVKKVIERPKNEGKRWNNEDRRRIIRYLSEGKSWDEIAKILGRPSANSVKLEWAKICQKGELVEITFNDNQHKYSTIASKHYPDPPEYEQDKGYEGIYDVVNRSTERIWYSFVRKDTGV